MRVAVVHWKAQEAGPHIAELRNSGHEAILVPVENGILRPLREARPDVFVIDLSRLPSHGLAVAATLRKTKSTRSIPLIFVGGTPEKTRKVRLRLPDALYAKWEHMDAALKQAVRSAPAKPVAPDPTSGYESASVAKKLGIAPGVAITVLGAPDEYPENLGLPDGVTVYRTAGHASQRVLVFLERLAQLELRFQAAERSVHGKSGIWLIWPKKSSGVKSDISAPILRQFGTSRGWVDYKVCALDRIWSGLLFGRKQK